MPYVIPLETRRAIVHAVTVDRLTQQDAAERFGVSDSSVSRILDEAEARQPYRYAPMDYNGGWTLRGGIKVPLEPLRGVV